MPIDPAAEFFVQGECNCKKCREQRKQIAASACIDKLKTELPFMPANFDIQLGFNGRGFPGAEALDAEITKLIAANKRTAKKFEKDGVPAKDARYCADCGTLHVKIKANKVVRDSKTRYLCAKCLEKNYFKCPECDVFQRKVDGRDVEGTFYCAPCAERLFKECPNCSKLFRASTLINCRQHGIRDWDWLCPKCWDDRTMDCEDCGMRIRKENAYRVSGKSVCSNCKEKLTPVKSYSYKPKPIFAFHKAHEKHRDDKFYFGWELEMEFKRISGFNRDKYAEELMELVGRDRIYMKGDSSINNDYGFEIVSYPMSWQRFKAERKDVWDKFFKWLDDHKATTESNRCGMHVHINKQSFTTMHSFKFIDFFYNPSNFPFIVAVSGRGGYRGNFKSYASLYTDYDEDRFKTTKIAKTKHGTSHHSAVDVCPTNTYEVRIFNGTADPKEFYKNLEFVHALYEFTRDTSRMQNTVQDFFMHLMKRNINDQYRNLTEWFRNNNKVVANYGLRRIMEGK